MSKKADTWMPWYVADYLADTAHLSTEQHGAYCLMLMAAWKRGGSLPNDDSQLAAVSRLSATRWKAHRAVLLEFFRDDGAKFVHGRVTLERLRAQEISDKKSAAGSKGGQAKQQNRNSEGGKPDSKGVAKGVADAKQTPTPLPSPLHLPSGELKGADAPLSPTASATGDGGQLSLTGDEEPAALPNCPHRRLLALYREKLAELPQPRAEMWEGSDGAESMRHRWKWLLTAEREEGGRYATNVDEGMEWFGRFFETVADTPLLMGKRGSWRANLAWLMKRENFTKVVEGRYDREGANA